MQKNAKKIAKNLEVSKKCIIFALSFRKSGKTEHQNEHQKLTKMNKIYFTKSYGEILLNKATINRNFRIKVSGLVNGQRVNKLVGVRGLLEVLGGSWERLVKFVLRAFNSLEDKCACKIYGGAKVTFYAK